MDNRGTNSEVERNPLHFCASVPSREPGSESVTVCIES